MQAVPMILAIDMAPDGSTLAVIAAVGIGVLGAIYFGIRFWLVSTRPADIRDIETPNLDRLNREALEKLGAQSHDQDESRAEGIDEDEEEENDDAPEGLKSLVSPEPPRPMNHPPADG